MKKIFQDDMVKLTALLVLVILILSGWCVLLRKVLYNNTTDAKKEYTDFYVGKIHYVQIGDKVINYSADSLDYANQTDTANFK